MSDRWDQIRAQAEQAYQLYLRTTGAKKVEALNLYLRLINVYRKDSPNSRPLQDYLNNTAMPDFKPTQTPDSPLGGIHGVAGLPKLD